MAGGGSSCVGIDRTSSIELEPRTLNIQQIRFAREAAMFVLNTKSVEEAFQIFTQGLEPVTSVARNVGSEIGMEDSGEEEEDERVRARSRRCRDVTTAPF